MENLTVKRCGRVLFASDDRGFAQLSVALYSLLSTADRLRPLEISVYTGCSPLTEEHRVTLRKLAAAFSFANMKVVDVDPYLEPLRGQLTGPCSHWGLMIWARCLVGEIERDAVGPIVYLDIDTLVCHDLGELYDMDMSDCGDGRPLVLGAVCEEGRATGDGHDPIWASELFDSRAERYFNSGFLVMNVAAFREERILEKIVAWYAVHGKEVVRPDQDALNCLFWDRVRFLHPKYNHCDGWLERQRTLSTADRLWRGNPPKEVLEAILDPTVLHFWGAKKPWNWNHRPEGKRYERVMREAGVLDGKLPGTTAFRRVQTVLFYAYHALLRHQVAHRFARLNGEN